MYDLYDNKKYKLTISNQATGAELKSKFVELSNITPEEYNIKFIFGGTQIKEDQCLYQHGIKNEYTIQIFKCKIINN